MPNESEAHHKARIKYRKEKTKQVVIQYTLPEYNLVKTYCDYKNYKVAKFLRESAMDKIVGDKEFEYNTMTLEEQGEDGNDE